MDCSFEPLGLIIIKCWFSLKGEDPIEVLLQEYSFITSSSYTLTFVRVD